MSTVTIADESPTGAAHHTRELPGLPDRMTAREIIRWRVRDEVARYNLHPSERFSGLVQPTDLEATVNGDRRRLDWEQQAEVAERAFEANGFFMLVADRQVESLDQELDLRSNPTVSFVKLVPLVGG